MKKGLRDLPNSRKNRPPGTGPSLPGPSPKFGFEPSEFLPEQLQKTLEHTLTKYLSFLQDIGFTPSEEKVSIKVEKLPTPNAYIISGASSEMICLISSAETRLIFAMYSH